MTRLLLVAPYPNRDSTGEAWSTWKWVDGLTQRFETTLLTVQYPHHIPLEVLFPNTRIVAMPGRAARQRFARWSHSSKPDYLRFYFFAQRAVRALQHDGVGWDIGHQLSPLALRYPSPLATTGIPYVLGPQAGSVANPPGFLRELRSSEPRYMRLRETDQFRFKHDPVLRSSLLGCSAFIAVAPYVLTTLPYRLHAPTYFEPETGLRDDSTGTGPAEQGGAGGYRSVTKLLYVGRITRSKGCRDLVRALPMIRKAVPGVHLDLFGDGPDRSQCEREAEQLGITASLTFHGRQPHDTVQRHYRQADLFVFPSFREPSGNVVFEAMQAGLPMVVATTGGPGHVVTDECGALVEAVTPQQFSRAIADAVVSLATQPETWRRCGDAARRRILELGTWETKLRRVEQIYRDVLMD